MYRKLDIDDLGILDHAVAQYRFENNLNKTRVSNLCAGIALAVPQTRHKLPWAQAVMLGLQSLAPSLHSLPMPRPAALALAVAMAQHGLLRASIVLVVQSAFGLRPSVP